MPDALDQQIQAYHRLLPDIKRSHGSVWALIAARKLVSTFDDFSSAAKYAIEHYPTEQVVIRHTDEAVETAPFVLIEE